MMLLIPAGFNHLELGNEGAVTHRPPDQMRQLISHCYLIMTIWPMWRCTLEQVERISCVSIWQPWATASYTIAFIRNYWNMLRMITPNPYNYWQTNCRFATHSPENYGHSQHSKHSSLDHKLTRAARLKRVHWEKTT